MQKNGKLMALSSVLPLVALGVFGMAGSRLVFAFWSSCQPTAAASNLSAGVAFVA